MLVTVVAECAIAATPVVKVARYVNSTWLCMHSSTIHCFQQVPDPLTHAHVWHGINQSIRQTALCSARPLAGQYIHNDTHRLHSYPTRSNVILVSVINPDFIQFSWFNLLKAKGPECRLHHSVKYKMKGKKKKKLIKLDSAQREHLRQRQTWIRIRDHFWLIYVRLSTIVIQDLNPDFRTNPDSLPKYRGFITLSASVSHFVCRITTKAIIWFHWNLVLWLGLPIGRTD